MTDDRGSGSGSNAGSSGSGTGSSSGTGNASGSGSGSGDRDGTAAPTVPVWGLALRALHWTLAAAVAAAWLSAENHPRLHEAAGWVALGAVALRLLYGAIGRGHARFASFVRGPRHTLGYAAALLRHREPRHLGHNPLGGWMTLALLACVAATGAAGWLFTTTDYWGDPRVEALHEGLAWALLVLVALHLAGVVHASLRQRENLVAAMLSGRKRRPGPDDVA